MTSKFRTSFIPVGRGVLQGDCLSPLLFNMCFNTYIQPIKAERYRQFGFSLKFLHPIHWFQFADDAAVITGQESENQHQKNIFKVYLPKPLINDNLIPTIKAGESFEYLGRFFNFNTNNKEHKSKLISTVDELVNKIDSLPLHPKNKLILYDRYVLSKLSRHFTISTIS